MLIMKYDFLAHSMLIFTVTLASGLIKSIEFESCGNGSFSFSTTDPNVAVAIRRHPLVKKGRIIDNSDVTEEHHLVESEKPKDEDKGILVFENITKAKNYLKQNFGVKVGNLKKPEDVMRCALEHGVKMKF